MDNPNKCGIMAPVCPRCRGRHWHKPRSYFVGGPTMRRCMGCGFSIRVPGDLVEVPTRVVCGPEGLVRRKVTHPNAARAFES